MGRVFETKWTEEKVRSFLESEDLSYQDIELPYGFSTGGKDRSWTCERIFAEDMSGKSVLDIGTKYGYFCFEALKRGANRVVGIDVDPESIQKAKMVADCLGAEVEFLRLNIEKEELTEKFDYVLCLNLLHHLKNPIGLLDKVIDLTKERLILEIASLFRHEHKKMGISLIQRHFLKRTPTIIVDRNGTPGHHHSQKFFMNIPAVENLLLHHRKTFARVDSITSEFGRGRFISIGYKRRIKKLIVIAGPTSSGKSTLIQKLQDHTAPTIAAAVGIEKGMKVEHTSANGLARYLKEKVDTLLFHYDILRPFERSAKTHDRDEALDILDTAEDIVILTLWTPPDILRKQFEERKILPRLKKGKKSKIRKRRRKIFESYADKHKILDFYKAWLEFCRTKKAKHFIVMLYPELDVISADEWTDLVVNAGLSSCAQGPAQQPNSGLCKNS